MTLACSLALPHLVAQRRLQGLVHQIFQYGAHPALRCRCVLTSASARRAGSRSRWFKVIRNFSSWGGTRTYRELIIDSVFIQEWPHQLLNDTSAGLCKQLPQRHKAHGSLLGEQLGFFSECSMCKGYGYQTGGLYPRGSPLH